jgi:hypothetical protein
MNNDDIGATSQYKIQIPTLEKGEIGEEFFQKFHAKMKRKRENLR